MKSLVSFVAPIALVGFLFSPSPSTAQVNDFQVGAGTGVQWAGMQLPPKHVESSMPRVAMSPQLAPAQPSAGLVINGVFDTSITSDPNAAAIEAAFNAAVAQYQMMFTDPVTVKILFRYSNTLPNGTTIGPGALGRSNWGFYLVPWSTVINALSVDAKSTNDQIAVASVPSTAQTTNIAIAGANGRSLGLNTPGTQCANGSVQSPPPAGCDYDGIVTLVLGPPWSFSRPVANGTYDAQRMIEHEMDEVLGTGSGIDLNNPITRYRPLDLWTWSAAGTRNVTNTGSRYFSIDGGTTNIVSLNQVSGGDFGDFVSLACPQADPWVQNAFSCPNQTMDISPTTPEGMLLDVMGFDAAAPPTVTNVVPTSGPTSGGTTVIISGTNFTAVTGVSFGGASTSFTVNSTTQISASAPPHAAGTVDITVTTSGGTSATSGSDQFTFLAAPTVTGVSPTSGATAGGTIVTITGTNFSNATNVSFGGTPAAAFAVNSPTQITATSPAHAAGTVDVTVSTAGGTSAASANDKFTYVTPSASTVAFAATNFNIDEGGSHIDVTVSRGGDTSGTASVDYATFDEAAGLGHASQKSDYTIALGTLNFAAGETSKTFTVFIVDDKLVEGNETIGLGLSNAKGTNVSLGSPSSAEITILENDTVPSAANPYDVDAHFFVRQHYLDFLNREPDQSGWDFWTNEITQCGANAQCIEIKRINVSAAFFLSNEFQNTGYLAYLTHRVAFGPNAPGSPAPVLYNTFMHDVQELGKGYVFTDPNGAQVLRQNTEAYFDEFVNRPEFLARYPLSLTSQQYVDSLLISANLSPDDYIVNMTNGQAGTNPTASGGGRRDSSYGTAHFVWNPAQTTLTVTGIVNNIDLTNSQSAESNDDLAGANIHAGANVRPGVTGPVVFGFNGTPFNDNDPNDAVITPFNFGIGGTFSTKWDASEGNGTTLSAQTSTLRDGHAYIGFNTNQFPNGEIRGDMPALGVFRQSLVIGLTQGDETRANVLQLIAQAAELRSREFNSAFVTMQYFGYLRRDPDTPGFNFWLGKLNSFGGNYIQAEMVKAFISSTEDRQRFGNP